MKSTTVLTLIGIWILVATVSGAANLTVETGETWIKWTWDSGKVFNISIDGSLAESYVTDNYYILSDLNPSELHTLSLKDPMVTIDSSSAYTTPSSMMIGLVFLLSLVFTVLTLIGSDFYRAIITGLMGGTLALFAAYLSSGSYMGFALFAVAFACMNGIVIGLFYYDRTQEARKYHG